MTSTARLSLGIDLGTSNSAAAVCLPEGTVESLELAQLVASDGIADRAMLPSVLFSPPSGSEVTKLPWDDAQNFAWIPGMWGREQSALLPGRAIISSKSWLCNSMVDRRAPILPWAAEDDVPKLSPMDAAVVTLKHLRGAALTTLTNRGITNNEAEVPLVVTVPASFEEAARTLTHEAATAAGFSNVTLLEEPVAALYAWFQEHSNDWRSCLSPGDIILVCDVGGGTSDFSLIAVMEEEGSISFKRLSVGEHILLGGDNMDLALAHVLRQRMEDAGQAIDQWQFLGLIQGARVAKETLLSGDNRETYSVAIASRGGSLFRNTNTVEIARSDVLQLVLEGFFPIVPFADVPRMRRSTALKDFGLPYAHDPAVTRHLASFLSGGSRNLAQGEDTRVLLTNGRVRPTKILFNGGVFAAHAFQERILAQVAEWYDGQSPEVLVSTNVESSVARGAAYYGGLVSQGHGIRIRAGLSRSYYIGVEPSELAVPGIPLRVKGVCVAPQGLEEGSEASLPGNEFVLATGEEVEFRLFSSTERSADKPGDVVSDAERDLQEGASIRGRVDAPEPMVPVTLQSRVSELGTMEISMKDSRAGRSWKFEFDVRSDVR